MKKKVHPELLRILAILMVLFQHSKTGGSLLFLTTSNNAEYAVSLLLELFCKAAVPLFFMISGAFLLGKEESYRDLFRKRILRMTVVLVGTSLVYYVMIGLTVPGKSLGLHSVPDFLRNLFHEPITAPLWFLYAYIAVLLVLPFLRKMVRSMENRDYMVLLLLHLAVVPLTTVAEMLIFRTTLTDQFRVPLAMESSLFFFLMGYFLENKLPEEAFTKKKVLYLSLGGVGMIFVGAVVIHFACLRNGFTVETVTPLLDRFNALPALTLYFATKTFPVPQKIEKPILTLGGNVFGLYLLEKGLREVLQPILTHLTPILTALPACFIWMAAVFISGQIIVGLLRMIPPVRKLI